ncbi:glycoside hydrolase family 3 protein [Sphingosinithalassobacter portus]|uniref:glycoside hydrolase family 3 protein n=1 Tax=Stakelama portus TaxID=2676234 RepID=UPI000D6E1CB2|nr:glycoside hydrolase family 3 protein [Sphingosinithalassobacter portus]
MACIASMPASAQQTDAPSPAQASVAHPYAWPGVANAGLIDPEIETRIDALMARMSLEEKVGQMIQADISTITPEDLRDYPLGSILAGGSSPPLGAPDRSPAAPWRATARAFESVAMEARRGHVPIPLLFGIDAVHGNNNIVGATLFPHNVGLGATRDPELIHAIGVATAAETAASGPNWAFGPTLAVPRDLRWGRAYEGYSEDPALVAEYAGAMVRGIQGETGKGTIQNGHVLASAKHFLADGGTQDGVDQGDAQVSEATLIAVHNAGYPPAIEAGVMSVMASFSSWNGAKMHGNKSLLTDVLKGRMGFDGLVVGDWNGHGQIPGCTNTDCPQTFLAGLDMAMAPDSWKGLYESTLAHARDGTIPMARIDDAVRRILRVKFRLGLFDAARPYADRDDVIGSADHRALARRAVRESLVLLKNDGVLPVKSSAHVLVAGPGADDIAMQSGGWTLSWQGDGNSNADFPNAQSIWGGISEAVEAGGGTATLSADGSWTDKPDVAIVVFGETPYAEMRGDVATLEFQPGDKAALAMLKRFRAAGIPTISVFLSGRPLWVNPEINASDAFVAAWLPGSEGGGIADVIIGDEAGAPRNQFTGTLSFSWPRTAGQFVLNRGMADYDPLFAFGYGLRYGDDGDVPTLSEEPGLVSGMRNRDVFFEKGKTAEPWSFATDSGIARNAVDSATAQEGAVQLRWPDREATLRIGGPALDLTREANADLSLQFTYRLDRAAAGPVWLSMGSGDPAQGLNAASLFTGTTGSWRTVKVPLRCYADAGIDLSDVAAPLVLRASGPLSFSLSDLRLVADPQGAACPQAQ